MTLALPTFYIRFPGIEKYTHDSQIIFLHLFSDESFFQTDKTLSSGQNLDLLHQSDPSLQQPLNDLDASVEAVRHEDQSANVNDALSVGVSNSADSKMFTVNGIIDLLKNEIKEDENIAVKSAILLKLLEVSALSSFAQSACIYVNTRAKYCALN